MREQAEAYIKDKMMNPPENVIKEHGGHVPNEEDWERIPRFVKDHFIDMVMGFNPGAGLIDQILIEYRKKSHSDLSFGVLVKQIIQNHPTSDTL